MQSGINDEYTCQVLTCPNSIWNCVRHKDDPANTSSIKKRKDQMGNWGWIMGMVSIMGTVHKANNAGTGMKAAKVDSPRDQAGTEEILMEELVNTAKKKGITVIKEPRASQFSKTFWLKV